MGCLSNPPVTARNEAVHFSAVQLRHLWIAAAYGLAMTSPCHCERSEAVHNSAVQLRHLLPPINILKPHNVVLPQVRAALDFDHFQWELAGVF